MDAIGSFANSTFALIVVLGIIIFFHESGHFLLAKAFGMRVFIFSFGFGKRLFGFKRGDTDYRVSLIPLGGYVKLEGEPDDVISEDTAPRGDGDDFTSRPRWQRLIVYFAGPAMNAVLAVLTFTIIFMLGVGMPGVRFEMPTIGAVEAGSPAALAGLEPGDTITRFDGEAAEDWEQVQLGILMRPNRDISLEVARGTERISKTMRSRVVDERMGDIGVFPLVRIGEVVAGKPAAAAGIKSGDGLLKVSGAAFAVLRRRSNSSAGRGERAGGLRDPARVRATDPEHRARERSHRNRRVLCGEEVRVRPRGAGGRA